MKRKLILCTALILKFIMNRYLIYLSQL